MSIALKNIYQVTRQQYNKLLNGETIAGHQYDDQALYLVEGEETGGSGTLNYSYVHNDLIGFSEESIGDVLTQELVKNSSNQYVLPLQNAIASTFTQSGLDSWAAIAPILKLENDFPAIVPAFLTKSYSDGTGEYVKELKVLATKNEMENLIDEKISAALRAIPVAEGGAY